MRTQAEIEGINTALEDAINDVIEQIDEIEKLKESVPLAKERVAKIMKEQGLEKVRHAGRTFHVVEPKISEIKLKITKKD